MDLRFDMVLLAAICTCLFPSIDPFIFSFPKGSKIFEELKKTQNYSGEDPNVGTIVNNSSHNSSEVSTRDSGSGYQFTKTFATDLSTIATVSYGSTSSDEKSLTINLPTPTSLGNDSSSSKNPMASGLNANASKADENVFSSTTTSTPPYPRVTEDVLASTTITKFSGSLESLKTRTELQPFTNLTLKSNPNDAPIKRLVNESQASVGSGNLLDEPIPFLKFNDGSTKVEAVGTIGNGLDKGRVKVEPFGSLGDSKTNKITKILSEGVGTPKNVSQIVAKGIISPVNHRSGDLDGDVSELYRMLHVQQIHIQELRDGLRRQETALSGLGAKVRKLEEELHSTEPSDSYSGIVRKPSPPDINFKNKNNSENISKVGGTASQKIPEDDNIVENKLEFYETTTITALKNQGSSTGTVIVNRNGSETRSQISKQTLESFSSPAIATDKGSQNTSRSSITISALKANVTLTLKGNEIVKSEDNITWAMIGDEPNNPISFGNGSLGINSTTESMRSSPIDTNRFRNLDLLLEVINSRLDNLTDQHAFLHDLAIIEKIELESKVDNLFGRFQNLTEALNDIKSRVWTNLETHESKIEHLEFSGIQRQAALDIVTLTQEGGSKLQEELTTKVLRLQEQGSELRSELRTDAIKILNLSNEVCRNTNRRLEMELGTAHNHITLNNHTQRIDGLSDKINVVESYMEGVMRYGDLKILEKSIYEVRNQLVQMKENDIYKMKGTTARLARSLNQLGSIFPRDCGMDWNYGIVKYKSGTYIIKPRGSSEIVQVYCDMEDGDRGWTVIQRRVDGRINFTRNWEDYRKGFGDINGEFWMGNELLHQMTNDHSDNTTMSYSLKIVMHDSSTNAPITALYSNFSLGPESQGYRLRIGNMSDTSSASDCLGPHHSGSSFSTVDRDLDGSSVDCAKFYSGGWWYSHCQRCNLNGRFGVGITWFDTSAKDWIKVSRVTMKIRREGRF